MADIHPAAVRGFAAGAAKYVAGRPEYPRAIEQWLTEELSLDRESFVVDLGAGTGKFTPRLLATGARVVAVEPVAEMLAHLTRQFPEVEAVSGSAEQIPLESATVDAVVCAQSFHWFATAAALHEILRVLKPGGVLGLIWNVRDDSIPWVAELSNIMKPFEGDTPRFHSQAWRLNFPFPGFSSLRKRRFSNPHIGPPQQVIVERILSVSFIAALSPAGQEQVADRLRQVIDQSPELAGQPQVTFPYETLAFACNKL